MKLTLENYKLIVSDEAKEDIKQYIYTIRYVYDASITAKKHYDGLIALLEKIEKNPTANAIRHSTFLLQYGVDVRRANFKKMAILYSINENVVYVHRIVAESLITD